MAGEMLRIIGFETYFMFLTASVQGISIILKKQKYVLCMYIAQIIEIVLAFVIGRFIFNNIMISIFIMVVTFITTNIIYFLSMFKVMKISRRKYLCKIIINLVIMIIISFAISHLVDLFILPSI
jgi:hypothetical protein